MSSPAKPLHQRLLFKIAAVIFVLYCLIWVLSSPIIKHFAKEPLAEYGLTLSDDAHISYNPFLTRITVLDLALTKDKSEVLTADHLVLQLALHKVPFNVIELEEFLVDGVRVKINKNKEDLVIAGVNIPPTAEESTKDQTQEESSVKSDENSTETTPSPYEVQLENLVISNTVLDTLVEGYPHQFTIENLLISDIQASQTQQSATLVLNALLDEAAININGQVKLKDNIGSINSDLKVSKYSLSKIKHFIEPLESLSGELSFASAQNITLSSEGIQLVLKNTELSTNNVNASTKNENISLKTFGYNISEAVFKLNETKNQNSQATSNTANNINGTISNTELTLAKLVLSTQEQNASLDDFLYRMTDVSVAINNSDTSKKVNNQQNQEKSSTQINGHIKSAQLTSNNIKGNTKEQRVTLANLLYNMRDFSVKMNQNEMQKSLIESINAQAEFVLSKALVEALPHQLDENKQETNNTDLPKILSFEELSLKNISPKLVADPSGDIASDLAVIVDSLALNQLLFSHNTSTDLPPIATIKQINVNNIAASAKALAINEITIDTISSHIILNKDKVLANLVSIASSQKNEEVIKETPKEIEKTKTVSSRSKNKKGKKPKTQKKEQQAEPVIQPPITEPSFYITLNQFDVINTNRVDFIDNSVDPIYQRSLMIDTLSVGKLSNLKEFAQEKTPVTLKGRSNQYANFAFDGFIQPFAQQKTYHLKGNLNELSLPDVSTYMKDALKLELKSGQLNTKLDITLIDDNIDGDVNININGLETTAANNDETNLVKDQVGIPFNVALGMLKDGNGDLVLDVPLSGKTSSPSFGISSFIALITKKAVMSATQEYLMTTFVPYANIVSVAMTAGEFILKLRFEDLAYEPKQIELNEKQATYIQQFAALMKDQKDTRVKICAISVPGDIDLPAGEKLSSENIKVLKDIGNQREQAFKAKVVNEAQIESGRILLCTPQIDNSKGAIPRMVISV